MSVSLCSGVFTVVFCISQELNAYVQSMPTKSYEEHSESFMLRPAIYRGYRLRKSAHGGIGIVYSELSATTLSPPNVYTTRPVGISENPTSPATAVYPERTLRSDAVNLGDVGLPAEVLQYLTTRLVAIVQLLPLSRYVKSSHLCGGIIVSPEWVLTAAHCVQPFERFHLFLRVITFTTASQMNQEGIDEFSPEGMRFRVGQLIIHPGFRVEDKFSDDIALIKIIPDTERTESLPWKSYNAVGGLEEDLEDIRLPDDKTAPCIVAGVGQPRYGGDTKQDASQRSMHIAVVTRGACDKLLGFVRAVNFTAAKRTHICAGGQLGDGDSCQGDSGGPLVCAKLIPDASTATGVQTWYLAGIASSGIGCGSSDIPSIYSRIHSYSKWIRDAMRSTR